MAEKTRIVYSVTRRGDEYMLDRRTFVGERELSPQTIANFVSEREAIVFESWLLTLERERYEAIRAIELAAACTVNQ